MRSQQNKGKEEGGRGEVSAFAYQLLNYEVVRALDARGDYGKLELLGFQVGYKFAERFARDYTKFSTTLDVVKFLCKDIWSAMFCKNVDKLQTNHKGTFVLHDNNHQWLASVDVDYKNEASVDEARKFLIVPCGLIRGALCNLGIKCSVRAEFSILPACVFNIQIHQELL